MRRTIYYILTICLLVCQTMVAAPAKKNSGSKGKKAVKEWKGANRNIHHISMWGGAGYSGLVNNYQNNRFIGGGGGLIGVGYEYKYDHFILSAGPEFRIFSSMDQITFPAPYDVSIAGDGYTQTKHYTFTRPMNENHIVGQVMVPIMVGGTWDKAYFLAGVKVGYTIPAYYGQNSEVEVTITDNMAYDPVWENMPSHGAQKGYFGFDNNHNNYGLDVTASAEVGVNINGFLSEAWNERNKARKYPLFMRVGLFADYGIRNLTLPSQGPMAFIESPEALTIRTRSLHASDWAKGSLNSLLVGVKFAALLQMNKPQPPKPQRPAMVLYLTDNQTGTAIAAATVEMTPVGVARPRTTKRNTNNKGVLIAKMVPGPYHLSMSHPDYIAMEHDYSHGDWGDTLRLSMQARPDFRFYVRDAKSDSLLAAQITFINNSNEAAVAQTTTDSLTGYAQLRLPINTPIRIHIEAANHFALTQSVSDIGGMETYRLEPIVKKRAIILHNLFFATNRTTILPESEPAMQDLYDLMNENPEIRILITGHTDNVGSDRANQKLSEGRANSVRDDLIKRGIDPVRIEAEGKGESQPITTNDTEEGRAQNRRVEFMVL